MTMTVSNGESLPRRSVARSIVIALVCTGTLIIQIFGSTSISTSLPSIGRDFKVPENQLQWLASAYALSSGCLLLFFGRIADLYGRKKVFIGGMSWSLIFSLACGFAQGYMALAILIAMFGLGLAAALPAAIGILASYFREATRSRSIAFATFSAGAPLGATMGGVVSGLLIELTDAQWRTPFYFTSGVIALIICSSILVFDNDAPYTDRESRRLDWIGALLITAGLVLIVFVLGQGEVAKDQWKTPYIIALLVVGVILVCSFALWESHLEHLTNVDGYAATQPLMKMSLFSRGRGRYVVMMSVAFLEYTCFNSWYFWMQLYYQDYLRLSPVHTAIRLLAMPITGVIVNVITALVIGRIPMVYFIGLGTGLTSVAAILYATMHENGSYWQYQFPALVISVTGADFTYGVGALYVAKLSEGREQSVTGGFFQTMTQMGTAFGVTITTVVFNRVNAGQNTGSASLGAYRAAWFTCAGFGAIACVLSVIFFSRVGILGHDPSKKDNPQAEETPTHISKAKVEKSSV